MTALTDFLDANIDTLAQREAFIKVHQDIVDEATGWYPEPDYTGVYANDDPNALWAVGADLMQGGIEGAGGTKVRLKGVSLFSLIYEDPFAVVNALISDVAIAPNINFVRVPIIDQDGSDFNGWDTKTPAQRDTYYTQTIEPIMNLLLAQGWYVILDYHAVKNWDEASRVQKVSDFWDYMAPKWKGNPKVIFEFYNEPADPSVYPFPGTLANYTAFRDMYQNALNKLRYQAPRQLILVGSPSYDTRTQYADDYPFAGTNLAYVIHFYPNFAPGADVAAIKAFWDSATPQNRVVFETELGYAVGLEGDGTDITNQPLYPDAKSQWLIDTKNVHPCIWSYGAQGLGMLNEYGASERTWWSGVLPSLVP